MNPERLLQQFDRITDSPDSIPRLRRFILDLAVRGKLVGQDPYEEAASQLLQLIQGEKARLVKEGKIRKQDALPLVAKEDEPFLAPAGWLWERLANLSRKIHYGFTASADKSIKAVRLVRITDIQNNAVNWDSVPGCEIADEHVEQFKLEAGDILIARTGGTIGKTFLVSQLSVIAVFASYLIRVQGSTHLCYQYLKCFFESSVYWKQLEDEARGAGQPNVNGQALARMMVPLPPLAEQQRIVAKVDELMGLCDQLEAAQGERERRRDRLVASSLHRLNQPALAMDADQQNDVREYARFYFNHLPSLTTRPEHITQLRQTVLNLAVRGRLAPQDPSDELAPSFEIVEQTSREDRVEMHLPRGWSWAKVEDVAEARLGKMLDKAKNSGDSYYYLRNTNVHWFDIRLDELKEIRLGEAEIEKYLLRDGDVLICEGGHGIGRTAVWHNRRDGIVFQKALHRVRPGSALISEFFAYCVFVYFHAGVLQTYFTGVGIPHFTGRALSALVFPLPPLAEQHRIVVKVEELMALCDQLEAQLATTKGYSSRRLLEAVLHEALHSADEREV